MVFEHFSPMTPTLGVLHQCVIDSGYLEIVVGVVFAQVHRKMKNRTTNLKFNTISKTLVPPKNGNNFD